MPGNVADAILRMLAQTGVKSIYGISGDAIFPLLDAIPRQEAIKYYSPAHENGAAFMASYEAKLTGRLAVCTATSGPGTVNLLNGLADAFFDKAPVLAINGQVDTKKIGTNTKQYFKQLSVTENFSLFSEMVVSPQALVPVLAAAIETAVNSGTVAHVSVPRDVFLMPTEVTEKPVVKGKNQIWGNGFAEMLETTVELLNSKTKPVILMGVKGEANGRAVCELAEKLGAAIVIAQQVMGVISYNKVRVIGGIGEGYSPEMLNQADCILIIGEAPYELSFLPESVPVIQITDKTANLHFGVIRYGIIGAPALVVKALEKRTARRSCDGRWSEMVAEERQIRRELINQDGNIACTPIHPARVIAELNRFAAEDAIITLDIGSLIHWFERGFLASKQTVLLSSHWRSMGSGLPAAAAAKIAMPEKQVLALVGDGGLLMSMGEFLTAVRYNLPITVIVFRNGKYNLEKYKMLGQGMNPFGSEIPGLDYAGYAEACGAKGFRINDPEQLATVLPQALNCQVPAIVDIVTADVPLASVK